MDQFLELTFIGNTRTMNDKPSPPKADAATEHELIAIMRSQLNVGKGRGLLELTGLLPLSFETKPFGSTAAVGVWGTIDRNDASKTLHIEALSFVLTGKDLTRDNEALQWGKKLLPYFDHIKLGQPEFDEFERSRRPLLVTICDGPRVYSEFPIDIAATALARAVIMETEGKMPRLN
jgi:hypothetical protein